MYSLEKFVRKYGQYKEVPSRPDEVRFCCPYCVDIGKPPDTKFHLYINLTYGVGYCFRCNKILKFGKKYKVICSFKTSSESYLSLRKKTVSLNKIPESISLFGSKGYEYLLHKLGNIYSKEEIDSFIKDYNLELCVDKNYPFLYYRIMIPIYFLGELVGFQFRTILGEDAKYITLGFKNKNPKNYLFNFDKASLQDKEVWLVEGVFDVFPLQDKAVAIFGKNLVKSQVNLLKLVWSKVNIALDKDAYDKAVQLASNLLEQGFQVSIVELKDDRDPCDLGKEIYNCKRKEVDITFLLGDLDVRI